jgi:YVTN family beta-propeller protein
MVAAKGLAAITAVVAAVGALAATEPDEARYVRQGLVVEFSAAPSGGTGMLVEDAFADVRFRITDEATGKPVRRLAPGAWMDMGDNIRDRNGAEQKSCKDKIALYLRGVVGIRPMIDLNSYYVVVMNREASLSIIDPTVSMVGRTSTLAQVSLPRPGVDWVRSGDGKRLFVTMPTADQVAVVDTDTFKLLTTVPAGAAPTRVVLQADGRYLWVGNDGRTTGAAGGVTVVDAESLMTVAAIPTGRGHHEIAISADGRYALVTNRDDSNLTLIDVRTLKRVRDIKLGDAPMSVAYSTLANAFYVADGRGGVVHALRPDAPNSEARVTLKSGIGPMRFSPDGRWLFVTNTPEDTVHVIDVSTNTAVHEIPIQGQPFQVEFTRDFAYVRSLGSERVSMVALRTIGRGKTPTVQSFAAGAVPPKAGGSLVLASSIATTAGEAGVLVANPADGATYFYMQGMNAASSSYKAFASTARAVTVVDRSLREIEPGVYAGKVKIPAAGRYDVAFSLDSPKLLHCFSATVAENPTLADGRKGLDVQYLFAEREVTANSTRPFRFRLVEKATGRAMTGLKDVKVMWYRAPGRDRAEAEATETGDGVYEAVLRFPDDGAWYVYVRSATLGKGYRDLPFFSLAARPAVAAVTVPATAQ